MRNSIFIFELILIIHVTFYERERDKKQVKERLAEYL